MQQAEPAGESNREHILVNVAILQTRQCMPQADHPVFATEPLDHL